MKPGKIAPELDVFYAFLLSQENQPYCWPTAGNRYSGKGLPGSLYPEGRDCSGTVTWAIWKAGGPDLRSTHNTKRMAAEWVPVSEAEALPGDVVLYANKSGEIDHVMTLTEDGRAFGATGAGGNCTTPTVARQLRACVRFEAITYRRPALYRRNPLRKAAP